MGLTVYEAQLTNQRIDDLRNRMLAEFSEVKNWLQAQTDNCDQCRKDLNARITILERFRTQILTVTSGISLLVGLVVGWILK